MPTRRRFDLVSDEVSRLQRVAHPTRPHTDPVADPTGAELVADDVRLEERLFYALANAEDVLVTANR